MLKSKVKVRFPCGLEYECAWHIKWVGGDISIPDLKEIVCPLHGKNCPSKNRRK